MKNKILVIDSNVNFLRIAARIAAVPIYSKIRNKSKDPFRLSEFKKLDQYKALDYAESRLEKLGSGSSRTVFALTSGKVLKIASESDHLDGAGVAQNEAEVEVFTNPKLKPIVTKIYDFDSNYIWLISETVRPISNPSEFENAVGVDVFTLVEIARDEVEGHSPSGPVAIPETADKLYVEGVVQLLKDGLGSGDIAMIEHWGKANDGRIVLLDYGLTNSNFKEFYTDSDGDSGDWAD